MNKYRLQAALPRVVPGTYYIKIIGDGIYSTQNNNHPVNVDLYLKSAIATQWRFYFYSQMIVL